MNRSPAGDLTPIVFIQVVTGGRLVGTLVFAGGQLGVGTPTGRQLIIWCVLSGRGIVHCFSVASHGHAS